jgi:hypothetical protein
MSLVIDQLNLRLPAGFEHRASGIASELGELLAGMDPGADRAIDWLRLAPVQVAPAASDRDVADAIAAGIRNGLQRSTPARRA